MISKDSHTQHISQQFNAELEEVRSHQPAHGQQVREVDDQINQIATSTRSAYAFSPGVSRRPPTCA